MLVAWEFGIGRFPSICGLMFMGGIVFYMQYQLCDVLWAWCLFVSMYLFPVGMIEYLFMLGLCRCLLRLSAYVASFTGVCGVGESDMYYVK